MSFDSTANKLNLFKQINLPINAGLTTATEGKFVPDFEFGINGRGAYDYSWIFIAAIIFGFITAAGIGANDVANSFATSVGSKTLKMWQAIVLAAFCEFFGAYLLGSRVTDTIRSSIVAIDRFTGHEDLLMFGMMCSIMVVGFWLFAATYAELPVSTTHSIVGAIIGFGLCSPSGGDAVNWTEVGKIVGSWFLSPITAGLFSGTFFFCVRRFILRSENSFDRAFQFFPLLVFVTFTINVIFILYKGGITKGQGLSANKLSDGESIGIAFGVGIGTGLIVLLIINPILKRYIGGLSEEDLLLLAANKGNMQLTVSDQAKLKEIAEAKAADAEKTGGVDGGDDDSVPVSSASVTSTSLRKVGRFESIVDRYLHQNYIHASVGENVKVTDIHNNAEAFSLKTEFAFGYLQVFTAMFASFAHGANDVANAIGPLAAVNSIYESGVGSAVKKSPVPDWILLLGGAGLVCGLALYGHVIIAAMGVKMVRITPARGFCIELGAAFIIVIGSFLALPLSSTHCAVGAIIGVGVVEGDIKKSVNWRLLGRVFLGWVFTLVIAGTLTAAVFSFGTFSPAQIYPLSRHNCFKYYAALKNISKSDPSNYTQFVDAAGTIAGMYGYPATGQMLPSLD